MFCVFCHPVCQKGEPETLWLGFLGSHTSLFLFLIQQDLGEAIAPTVSHFVLGNISEENIRHVLMHGTNECMKEPPSVTVRRYLEAKRKRQVMHGTNECMKEPPSVTLRRYLEAKRKRQVPVNDQKSIAALA